MSRIWKDKVAETSTTTGTGALTLAGAITGYRTLASVCSVGDTLYYTITGVDASGVPTGEWETGLGTYSATNTLTRTTVLDSSNSGSPVSFSAGTKRVTLSVPAAVIGGLPTASPLAPWTIPVLSGFTTSNLGTTTLADSALGIAITAHGGQAFEPRGFYMASPGGAFNLYARYSMLALVCSNNDRFGVAVRNSGSGKIADFGFQTNSSGDLDYAINQWNGTSYGGNITAAGFAVPGTSVWARIENDGTNLNYYIGDGYNWYQVLTETLASWLGSVDQIGFNTQIEKTSLLVLNSFSTTAPAVGGGGPA